MEVHMSTSSLRGAAAAVILIVPVALELVWHPFGDHTLGLEVFALSQIMGWLLIRSMCRQTATPSSRRSRFGRTILLSGCWLQVAFGTLYGLSAAVGQPADPVFGLFLLGFLAIFAGGLMWGVGLVGAAPGGSAGLGLVATASLGLMAMIFAGDPWHDVFLLSSYAAWAVVGRGFDTLTDERGADSRQAATNARG